MAERDFEPEFLKTDEVNFSPVDGQGRIVEASNDELIDILFLNGGQGYLETSLQLEVNYLLSPGEADRAISLGLRRISDSIKEQNQDLRRGFNSA